jgi:hypothetical protein
MLTAQQPSRSFAAILIGLAAQRSLLLLPSARFCE